MVVNAPRHVDSVSVTLGSFALQSVSGVQIDLNMKFNPTLRKSTKVMAQKVVGSVFESNKVG